MAVIRALSIFLSFVFHGLLCLILFTISSLAIAAGAPTLQLGMLPWTGSTLLYTLHFGSLAGLAAVVLAIWGRWRPLFFVCSPSAAAAPPPGEFGTAILLMVGSWIALLGSWARMGRPVGAHR